MMLLLHKTSHSQWPENANYHPHEGEKFQKKDNSSDNYPNSLHGKVCWKVFTSLYIQIRMACGIHKPVLSQEHSEIQSCGTPKAIEAY
jgi:hypothetical protein